jgi:ElaB/YqjD/DUF883 family membrane-anchored ribosome-binding protein
MNQSNQASQDTNPAGPRTRDEPATEKARERAHESIDSAAARAAQVERRIREETAGVQETLREKQAAAAEQVDHSLERVESFIRARPMIAAGIAFAAGVLASRLLRN